MAIIMEPIGIVHTDTNRVPRHWTVSDVKGTLVIEKNIRKGLRISKADNKLWLFSIFTKVRTLLLICLYNSRHTVMKNWGFSAFVRLTGQILWGCRFWMFFRWRITSFIYRDSICWTELRFWI
jgi:hypothetical protein